MARTPAAANSARRRRGSLDPQTLGFAHVRSKLIRRGRPLGGRRQRPRRRPHHGGGAARRWSRVLSLTVRCPALTVPIALQVRVLWVVVPAGGCRHVLVFLPMESGSGDAVSVLIVAVTGGLRPVIQMLRLAAWKILGDRAPRRWPSAMRKLLRRLIIRTSGSGHPTPATMTQAGAPDQFRQRP